MHAFPQFYGRFSPGPTNRDRAMPTTTDIEERYVVWIYTEHRGVEWDLGVKHTSTRQEATAGSHQRRPQTSQADVLDC